jgi:hypothetical protein
MSVPIGAQSLYELSSKFREIARPDRLPYVPHSVKEEGQIVVRDQDARKHLTCRIKMP